MTRPVTILGNWKMHKTAREASTFVSQLAKRLQKTSTRVYIAPSFIAIGAAAEAARQSEIVIGAQNLNENDCGAFTGEVSSEMIKEAGARFVIIGHSERRNIFHETDADVNSKVKKAVSEGLQPILCIGESKEERNQNHTHKVLEMQLREGLAGLSSDALNSLLIAYEPIWAIGSGSMASPEMAQEAHHHCREIITEIWGEKRAKTTPILYGGSVKPEMTKALMQEPDIDGALVGGASLDIETFYQIIQAAGGS